MSHYALFTKVRNYPEQTDEYNANGMIQIILGGMLRAYENRLDVESRQEKMHSSRAN